MVVGLTKVTVVTREKHAIAAGHSYALGNAFAPAESLPRCEAANPNRLGGPSPIV